MKALKIVLGIFAAIIGIYLVMCLMGPKKMDDSATLEMESPAYLVYNTISDLTTWSDWGPWMQDDPSMKTTMGAQTKGVGGSYSWTGAQGEGNLEIVEAEANKSMKTKIQFDGFEGYSYGNWSLEENDGKTSVTWGMVSDNDLPFIMRGMMMMMEPLGVFFERGLNNLKAIVEEEAKNQPATYGGYTINEVDFPARSFVMKRDKVNMTEITPFYAENFGALAGHLGSKGAEMDGMPSGLFFDWSEETGMADMAAAIGTNPKIEVEGFENMDVPAGKALSIDYYGDYSGAAKAHAAMDEYMKAKGISDRSLIVEEYITDPSTEPDPSKWLTKIYYIL